MPTAPNIGDTLSIHEIRDDSNEVLNQPSVGDPSLSSKILRTRNAASIAVQQADHR